MRIPLIIYLCLIPACLSGQLYSVSDHHVNNTLAINPAFSGSREALNTSISHRSFRTGFEGSPTTLTFSIDAPLNNERVGLGLFILNDKIGVTNETSIIGNYAYRLDMGYGKLSFGLGLGLIFNHTNWSKLEAHDGDDELLTGNFSSGIMPDFSFGVYYKTAKYFMGLSLPLLLSHEYDNKTDKYIIRNKFAEYNYFYNAGYVFDIDHNFKLFPSLLVKYHKGTAPQIDINTQVILKERVWLGASYRSKNILVGMAQYQVNNQFRVACSYDYSIGKKGKYNNNSYEVMLSYLFRYKVEVAGPRAF